MRVAVVYESLFGNTRLVAEAIADGMRERDPAAQVTVGTAARARSDAAAVDLLVVGAPTHFLGLPTRRSRHLWLRDGDLAAGRARSGHPIEPDAGSGGARDFVAELADRPGAWCATFDTRLDRRITGSAGARLARRMRRHGYRLVVHPESFTVADMEGPLQADELEHARAWGAALLDRMQAGHGADERTVGP